MKKLWHDLEPSRKKQTLLITGAAVMLFFLLRLAPGAVAPERPGQFLAAAGATDRRVELCDVSNLGFSAVNDRVSPVRLHASPLNRPAPGEEVEVVFSIETVSGKAITFDDIQETHEEMVHLLIVDPSLGDYQHKHPRPGDVPGEYRFSFTPREAGDYKIFAEFYSLRTGRPVYAVTDFTVPGEERPIEVRTDREIEVGDYRFELAVPEQGYRAGRPQALHLRVAHRESGRPVTLQPIMGEYAHLVGFDTDRSGFTHMHPLLEGTGYDLDPLRPEIGFMLQVNRPGFYKIWAQLKIDGREIYVPFGMEVKG
jgi:hypothetical protein